MPVALRATGTGTDGVACARRMNATSRTAQLEFRRVATCPTTPPSEVASRHKPMALVPTQSNGDDARSFEAVRITAFMVRIPRGSTRIQGVARWSRPVAKLHLIDAHLQTAEIVRHRASAITGRRRLTRGRAIGVTVDSLQNTERRRNEKRPIELDNQIHYKVVGGADHAHRLAT